MTDYKKEHTELSKGKRRRWPWALLLGAVILLILVRLSLRTDFVRGIVKDQLLTLASQQLTVDLTIDELQGDLWKEVVVKGVSLGKGDTDTLASIDRVGVKYNLLSYFKSEFEISEIAVTKPFVKLRQRDSVLNVTTWVKESPQDTAASESFPLRVDKFSLSKGRIDAQIEALAQDSAFVIDNIMLNSSFALWEDGYEAQISDFSFDILQTRLEKAISFKSQFQAEKQTISLQKLVIATGNSVLQSSGTLNTRDSTTDLSFQAQPLAWRDIAAYVDQSPVHEDLKLDLSIKGNTSRFHVGLGVEATGIEQLKLGVDLAWDPIFSLTKVRFSANRVNLDTLLDRGETALPSFQNIQLEANGNVPFRDYENGFLEGTLTTDHIYYRSYELERLNSSYSFSEGTINARAGISQKQQKIQATLDISEAWASYPQVVLTAEGHNINPGYWTNDDQFVGDLDFSAEIEGKGLSIEKTPWNYRMNFGNSEFAKQEFNKLSLQGKITNSTITNETVVGLKESEIVFSAKVDNYRNRPRFNYRLHTNSFDLSECRDLEEFTSALSIMIEGEGSGSSLETLQLTSAMRMDSSVVNGEYIERFAADIVVKDTVVTIKPAELKSTIADGSFDARLHLNQWYDIQNELNLDMVVKEIQPLAPLLDIEEISAEGKISGKLAPGYGDTLKFTGNVSLKDIIYNDIFNARETSGKVEVFVTESPEFILGLDLVSPSFSAVQLRDINVQTRGKILENKVRGNFNLNFKGPKESEINHAGQYDFTADSSVIITKSYDLKSSLRTLELQKPFTIVIENQSIQTDTLRLASDDGAVLELAVPYADSVRQEGYLNGDNLNLTAIQNTLLSNSYFEGTLSGNLSVANSDSSFESSGKLLFSDLKYQETSLDSLKLELDIGSGQLVGKLEGIDKGKKLMTGEVNLPFRLGDPEQFEDTFFEKPVNGYFTIEPVRLSKFGTLFSHMGVVDTEGLLQVDADLSGKAGQPHFVGSMALDSAIISGVKIDSVTADLQYIHESSKLSLNATVNSLKQRAAEIEAEVPFYLDLKNGNVSLPDEKDSISVDIITNNFNLAAFNDFVNREQVRNIKGRVNGKVNVEGIISELETKGELNVTEGSVRVVQTGVTVDGMRATFVFQPGLLTVENFMANSGGGSMNMNGSIGFEELVPGDIDLVLKAKNFKVANSSQYNATINLDTKMMGSFTRPDISGSLSVLNGFVQLDNFGEKSVEYVQLDSSAQSDPSVAIYDSLSLDMDVSFNRRFFIRNQRYLEMQVELDGSVDMQKDAGKELQMFGSLETVDGYARPLGKRFELEEGVVTFTGDASNPELNIRTLYEPPQPEEEVMIWYTIEGNVEEPKFKYESSPPMELEDILCYTLFGQPCFALESWKRAVASSGSNSSATDLALEVLMDRVESLATQRLGIDVVKIDNTRVGSEIGTSITTGWYINPKVFFAVQNVITSSTPDTSFLLEYLLKKNLKLIISQGNDSRQGIDLKWNYDY